MKKEYSINDLYISCIAVNNAENNVSGCYVTVLLKHENNTYFDTMNGKIYGDDLDLTYNIVYLEGLINYTDKEMLTFKDTQIVMYNCCDEVLEKYTQLSVDKTYRKTK